LNHKNNSILKFILNKINNNNKRDTYKKKLKDNEIEKNEFDKLFHIK